MRTHALRRPREARRANRLVFAGLPLRADARLLAVDLGQLGAEPAALAASRQVGRDGPVLLGGERGDLALAVDDQAHRHALHAAGREATADLAAHQRTELVA